MGRSVLIIDTASNEVLTEDLSCYLVIDSNISTFLHKNSRFPDCKKYCNRKALGISLQTIRHYMATIHRLHYVTPVLYLSLLSSMISSGNTSHIQKHLHIFQSIAAYELTVNDIRI